MALISCMAILWNMFPPKFWCSINDFMVFMVFSMNMVMDFISCYDAKWQLISCTLMDICGDKYPHLWILLYYFVAMYIYFHVFLFLRNIFPCVLTTLSWFSGSQSYFVTTLSWLNFTLGKLTWDWICLLRFWFNESFFYLTLVPLCLRGVFALTFTAASSDNTWTL